MILPRSFPINLNLLSNSLYFFRKHFLIIIGLGLIAAFGRVIQLEGFGPIPAWMNVGLEVIIESSRILLLLYVLGMASIKKGVLGIKVFFCNKQKRKLALENGVHSLKKYWLSVILNILGLLMIATVINYLIDLLAYQTCLFLKLKTNGILVETSSEWAILLFFKNLTVIPLTLIFDSILVLWLIKLLTSFSRPPFA